MNRVDEGRSNRGPNLSSTAACSWPLELLQHELCDYITYLLGHQSDVFFYRISIKTICTGNSQCLSMTLEIPKRFRGKGQPIEGQSQVCHGHVMFHAFSLESPTIQFTQSHCTFTHTHFIPSASLLAHSIRLSHANTTI